MSRTKAEEQSLPSRTAQTGDGSPTGQWSVSRAQAKDLAAIWPQLVPQIRKGLRKGAGDTLTEHGLFRGVAHGEVDLWIVHKGEEILGAMFLRIDQRDRGKALVVLDIVAGTGRGYRQYAEDMLPRLREYGEMIGAYTIEGVCRLGAARLLSRLGCKPKAIIMELSDGRRSYVTNDDD